MLLTLIFTPFPYDFLWFFFNWVLVSTVQETVLKSAVIWMPCQAVSRHGIPGSIWYLVKTPEKITAEDKVSFVHRMHVGIMNSWLCYRATILTNLCCLVSVLQKKKQLWVKASILFLLFIYIFFPFENDCNSILFSLSLLFYLIKVLCKNNEDSCFLAMPYIWWLYNPLRSLAVLPFCLMVMMSLKHSQICKGFHIFLIIFVVIIFVCWF